MKTKTTKRPRPRKVQPITRVRKRSRPKSHVQSSPDAVDYGLIIVETFRPGQMQGLVVPLGVIFRDVYTEKTLIMDPEGGHLVYHQIFYCVFRGRKYRLQKGVFENTEDGPRFHEDAYRLVLTPGRPAGSEVQTHEVTH